jgi:hypothetical protein
LEGTRNPLLWLYLKNCQIQFQKIWNIEHSEFKMRWTYLSG